VFVECLGGLLGRFDPRAAEQVKSKRCSLERRNVLVELHDKERLAVARLLNSEAAVATLSFLFRQIAQYRTELRPPPMVGLSEEGCRVEGPTVVNEMGILRQPSRLRCSRAAQPSCGSLTCPYCGHSIRRLIIAYSRRVFEGKAT
jgi:hypothetical protein